MYDPCVKTLFIGKKIIYLPTCHSTNDIAAELVRKENLSEGTLVITDSQTAGRGQRGASWVTSQGQNFTFSLILRPTFLAPGEQFLLSQAISLGVRDFVSSITEDIQIKWPNDLYINDFKLGGILIESTWQGARMAHAVVGIGLNINQTHFESSIGSVTKGTPQRATSLRLETGQCFELAAQLPHLLQALEHTYLRLRGGRYEAIRNDYQSALLGYGEKRLFRGKDGRIFEGTVTGVTALGKLCIRHADGVQLEYDIKEVEWLWPDQYSSQETP
ncbi:biotin--[acetyl-CoA-carboxylase] ligase [Salmonirosea aquatica]|uniref:Biotin--[acetyl-CoA-carboxylase] ligase n=1 Tax=Salmonirosea aquatica TaxID=2654236 RepID=A0A7C9BCT4_9BACT|nr:biotin--[acetyl-CoA-carboxylase] ligase [Cytophagaceae bacterium SJW1-29]